MFQGNKSASRNKRSSTHNNDHHDAADDDVIKRRRLLYRYNLATLRPENSYKDGENPYDMTLRQELQQLGPTSDDLASSRLLTTSAWSPHNAHFRLHEFELTAKVKAYSLASYIHRYEESPTLGDTLTEEDLKKAFKFNEKPRSERPYELTLYANLWNLKYLALFDALNDSEYEEQQRSKIHGEWFNDGGIDIFPPSRNGTDWGKQYLHYIVDKKLWHLGFKSLPTTQILVYDTKSTLVPYKVNPFQRRVTKPNDGTQHGYQEVVFPNASSLLKEPNEREPYFEVAPFEKGANTLHVIGGALMFQATVGVEYKLCGAPGSKDRDIFRLYFNPNFATGVYDPVTQTIKLSQSNLKENGEEDYNGTFDGSNGRTYKMSFNKIILRNYFYNPELDPESDRNTKILRGKENISLYTLKNNTIGDPTNIEKECQLNSYSEFLTSINQMCTNARKFYGVHSIMHQASKELLSVAMEEVQNSRDNLLYRFKNENVDFIKCRGQAIGERAESEAIHRLMGVYGGGGGGGGRALVPGVTEGNVLDYECVKCLVEDQHHGGASSSSSGGGGSSSSSSSSSESSSDVPLCNYLEWISRFKAKYPKMMELKATQIKGGGGAGRMSKRWTKIDLHVLHHM